MIIDYKPVITTIKPTLTPLVITDVTSPQCPISITTNNELTQRELVQKFNTAFYEAQQQYTTTTIPNSSTNNYITLESAQSHPDDTDEQQLFETFDETYFTNIEQYENSGEDNTEDNYLLDYLIGDTNTSDSLSNVTTPSSECTSTFDYKEFSEHFEQEYRKSSVSESDSGCQTLCDDTLSCQTDTHSYQVLSSGDVVTYQALCNDAMTSYELVSEDCQSYRSVKNDRLSSTDSLSCQFTELTFHQPNCNYDSGGTVTLVPAVIEDLTLIDDVDDLESLSTELGYNSLTFIDTIAQQSNDEFTAFLRNSSATSLLSVAVTEDANNLQNYGHLITATGSSHDLVGTVNNNLSHVVTTDSYEDDDSGNLAVMCQSDALLYDDPMLSSSNDMRLTTGNGSVGNRRRRLRKDTVESDVSSDWEEGGQMEEGNGGGGGQMQCRWEHCNQTYECQRTLVKHIEKCHVELKRGEEFTCYWASCPRKTKPFNARYKLLIHMRVHSGEKPNKCPFNGCDKAFSRLENLKIHQRSHTGERPYSCTFTNCSKSFSNSSDRAKHQRTHFDTKPYGCLVYGCAKKYTDPSSLRKHVKNHSYEEQCQLKNRSATLPTSPVKLTTTAAAPQNNNTASNSTVRAARHSTSGNTGGNNNTKRYHHNNGHIVDGIGSYAGDHSYSHSGTVSVSMTAVKLDLKNKISEKLNKERLLKF